MFSKVFRIWAARAIALATGFYWAFLLYATHYPKPGDFLGANAPPDKLLHLIAYGGLGFLAAATLWAYRGWSLRNALQVVAALAVAAILDELTQPLFSRAADPVDWAYDCLGLAGGILAVGVLKAVSSLAWERGSR